MLQSKKQEQVFDMGLAFLPMDACEEYETLHSNVDSETHSEKSMLLEIF